MRCTQNDMIVLNLRRCLYGVKPVALGVVVCKLFRGHVHQPVEHEPDQREAQRTPEE